MDVVVRLIVVVAAAAVVLLAGDAWQARNRSGIRTSLPAGIALVVAPACRLCDGVRQRLATLGVEYATVQAGDERLGSLTVRTAPTLVCVDDAGRVQAVRSGRAAIARIEDIVDCGSTHTTGATA